jgi:hypothetical protein
LLFVAKDCIQACVDLDFLIGFKRPIGWDVSMSTNSKKLLYQLEQDLFCTIDGVFSDVECDRFDAEVGDGVCLRDSDGREVVSFHMPRMIRVSKGYRWDGCSPKINVLDLFWIGTPDGLIVGSERPLQGPDLDSHIPITDERVTHLASCVHDVLGYCKYDENMPTLFRASLDKPDLWRSQGRRNRDLLFLELLKTKGHGLAFVYYFFVISAGPVYDFLRGVHSKRRRVV